MVCKSNRTELHRTPGSAGSWGGSEPSLQAVLPLQTALHTAASKHPPEWEAAKHHEVPSYSEPICGVLQLPPGPSEVSWGLQHIQKQPRTHHQAKHLSGFLNNPVPTAAPPITAPKLRLLSQCLCDSSHILLSRVLAFPYFFFF